MIYVLGRNAPGRREPDHVVMQHRSEMTIFSIYAQILITDPGVGLLHFQFVDWGNFLVKQVLVSWQMMPNSIRLVAMPTPQFQNQSPRCKHSPKEPINVISI